MAKQSMIRLTGLHGLEGLEGRGTERFHGRLRINQAAWVNVPPRAGLRTDQAEVANSRY